MSLMERLQKIVTVAQSTKPVAAKDTLEARLRIITAPLYQALLLRRQAQHLSKLAHVLGEKSTGEYGPLLQLIVIHSQQFGPETTAILIPTQEQTEAARASAEKIQAAAQAVLDQCKADIRKAVSSLSQKLNRIAGLQNIPEINAAVGDTVEQAEFKELQRDLRDLLNRLDRATDRNNMDELLRITDKDLIVWRMKIRKWEDLSSNISLAQLQQRYSLSDGTVNLLTQWVEGKSSRLGDATASELAELLQLPRLALMLSIRLEA